MSWPITEATKWWKVVNSLCILACPSCLHMTRKTHARHRYRDRRQTDSNDREHGMRLPHVLSDMICSRQCVCMCQKTEDRHTTQTLNTQVGRQKELYVSLCLRLCLVAAFVFLMSFRSVVFVFVFSLSFSRSALSPLRVHTLSLSVCLFISIIRGGSS